jgi:hypothetical protein
MKKMKKNTISIAIILFLMFAMTTSLVAIPATTAQDATRATYSYIGATPNPIGVGQETLLHVGITQQLSIVGMGWEGLSVTITRPDGTTETLRDITTDATGGTGRIYVPTMEGNYTLQTHFPEQVTETGKTTPGTPMGTRMLASTSEPLTLIVQAEPLPTWPTIPLPTEYWTRPIDAQLYEWHAISGNWVQAPPNLYAPYNDDAPETAHILWAKQLAVGGLAGGLMGRDNLPHSFECGDAYQPKFGGIFGAGDPVIIGGVLYYNRYETRGQPYAGDVDVCAVDLRTGKELWCKPLIGRTGTSTGATVAAANRVIDEVSEQFPDGIGRRLIFGQVFYWDSYNYHGVYGLLWTVTGTTWMAFDVHTGRWIYTITNVPSGTTIRGVNGELLVYQANIAQGTMALWNSSNLVSLEGNWNPHGNIYNASGVTAAGALAAGPARAWEWNITIPTGLQGSIREVKLGNKVVGQSITLDSVTTWAFSLQPGQEGRLLYNEAWQAPTEWAAGNLTIGAGPINTDAGVATVISKEQRQRYSFSTETGKYLWVTEPENYLGMWDTYGRTGVIAYDKLFTAGMGGIIYCYDIKTGERLWTYEAEDPLNEILWSQNWPQRAVIITDGKIYLAHDEHSPIDPKPRGAPFICLDVETGDLIWRADGLFRSTEWGGKALIGDSIIATMDTYDQRIYAIGKGPSATIVTAPDTGVPLGTSVLVSGTVTDVSPGTEDYALRARFPNGVPAVADESMSEWMLHVYKQFPTPADVIGVEVVVSVLDPNNNYYEVGTTTANSNGFFSVNFEPEVPGKYSIVATFEGSRAYYGSFAETAVFVEEAPPPPKGPTPPPASTADLYLVPGIISIIVAIAVVGAVIVLMLRKH